MCDVDLDRERRVARVGGWAQADRKTQIHGAGASAPAQARRPPGERFNGPARDTAQGYRAMLDRLCEDAGFTPEVAYVVGDVTVARAFVAAGVSVALIPEFAIEQPRPDVAVRPVPGLDPSCALHATWLRGRRAPAIPVMARSWRRRPPRGSKEGRQPYRIAGLARVLAIDDAVATIRLRRSSVRRLGRRVK